MRSSLAGPLLLSGALLSPGVADATPSTTYWTPMTVDFQAPGVLHIGVDNYFTVGKKMADGGQGFPTDVGLTLGVRPFSKLQIEFGLDHLGPSDDPWYFNVKLGVPEGALFRSSPTVQVGLFNVGTKKNATNQQVLFGVIGRTFPGIGRLSFGPYVGNGDVLRNGQGQKQNSGVMIAFDRGFWTVRTAEGDEFSRWVIAGDYASGDNAIGGGGVGLYYYFTKSVSLLVGPVWFNDERINGTWKWTIQLDINHPRLFGR
jgi:hypothetical protein